MQQVFWSMGPFAPLEVVAARLLMLLEVLRIFGHDGKVLVEFLHRSI